MTYSPDFSQNYKNYRDGPLGPSALPGLPMASYATVCVVRTVRFRPLPTFREIKFVLSILRSRSLT